MNQNWIHWAFDIVLGILFWFVIADRKSIKDDIKDIEEDIKTKADHQHCKEEREQIYQLLHKKVNKETLILENRNSELRFHAIETRAKERYYNLNLLIADIKGDNKSEHKDLKDCVNAAFKASRETKEQVIQLKEQIQIALKKE